MGFKLHKLESKNKNKRIIDYIICVTLIATLLKKEKFSLKQVNVRDLYFDILYPVARNTSSALYGSQLVTI